MADYKETNVSGKSWQRCHTVVIYNPYDQTASIALREEQVTEAGGERFFKPMGEIKFPFDPNASIALKNPITGEDLGQSMTQQQIYVALWSLYMAKAAARDAEA